MGHSDLDPTPRERCDWNLGLIVDPKRGADSSRDA